MENVLGKENPTSLNYIVFFLVSQHFGTGGRQEHHKFKWKTSKQPMILYLVKLPQLSGVKDQQKQGKAVSTNGLEWLRRNSFALEVSDAQWQHMNC